MTPEVTKWAAKLLGTSTYNTVLIGGNGDRSSERARAELLFFEHGKPQAVARWYRSGSGSLAEEQRILEELAVSKVPAPKLLGATTLSGRMVLLESYVPGRSLELLLNRKLISPVDGVRIARATFNDLHEKTSRPSTTAALADEIDRILGDLSKDLPLASLREALSELIRIPLIKWHTENDLNRTSLVHFDFITRNILSVESMLPVAGQIIDLEFTARSHFAWYDWLRFIEYSPLTEGLGSLPDEEPGCVSLLRRDVRAWRAAQALASIIDYTSVRQVYPDHRFPALAEALSRRLAAVLHPLPTDSVREVRALETILLQGKNSPKAPATGPAPRTLEEVESLLFNAERRLRQTERRLEERLLLVQTRAQEEYQKLHEIATQRMEELISKDCELIQARAQLGGVIRSKAFKIGRVITGSLRRISGLSRTKNQP